MPTDKPSTLRRRTRRISLSIVPALAALAGACSSRKSVYDARYDPCEQTSFVEIACDSAVTHHGYYYNNMWYPHVYPYGALYYYSRYTGFLAGGGHVRTMSPTVYVPSTSSPVSRPSVVRGGFGNIGSGKGAAGS
jgi:hypothetical protein